MRTSDESDGLEEGECVDSSNDSAEDNVKTDSSTDSENEKGLCFFNFPNEWLNFLQNSFQNKQYMFPHISFSSDFRYSKNLPALYEDNCKRNIPT